MRPGMCCPTTCRRRPTYAKFNPADAPIMTLAVTSRTLKLTDVEDLSFTRLAQKISQLPGIGVVSISGGQRPAVRIQFNPRALAKYGLNIDDLRTTISNANSNSPKGSFDGATQSSSINANDQITDIDGYRNIIVAYLNGSPGPSIRRRPGADGAREHQAGRLGRHHAVADPEHPAAAGRQCDSGRRLGQETAAESRPGHGKSSRTCRRRWKSAY